MGNKLGRRRQVVDEKYTRPQGLYQIKDVDYKKLRKLILESKLAPCYPGGDECDCGLLEECPICFLYYPTLNRSRCCMKSICTECFLQMRNPNSTCPTQCPFCKTSNYAVEYHGVKSKAERGLEQIEEQKVIEAKIRMRQQELQVEEQRIDKIRLLSSSSTQAVGDPESVEVTSLHSSDVAAMLREPQQFRQNGGGEFDLDLEDIMVMEAIWLSIQENRVKHAPSYDDAASQQYAVADQYVSPVAAPLARSASSRSGGLACAIPALAEHQQMGGESLSNYSGSTSASDVLPCGSRKFNRAKQNGGNHPPTESYNELLHDGRTAVPTDGGDWVLVHSSDIAEAGTSYASSDESDDGGLATAVSRPPPPYDVIGTSCSSSDRSKGHVFIASPPPPPPTLVCGMEGNFQFLPGPIIPDSFEEQMMLAMAISLAEARARTTA
ncbi:hypothetical protein Ancab_004360 [Ancistrocladus abbreviatus]